MIPHPERITARWVSLIRALLLVDDCGSGEKYNTGPDEQTKSAQIFL
jgi:hypothetical protein